MYSHLQIKREDVERFQSDIEAFREAYLKYVEKKKNYYVKVKQRNQKSGWFSGSQNQLSDYDMGLLKSELNQLKKAKDNRYLEFRKQIHQAISNDDEFKMDYNDMIEARRLNHDLRETYGEEFVLLSKKKQFDKVLTQIELKLNRNDIVSLEEQEKYQEIAQFINELNRKKYPKKVEIPEILNLTDVYESLLQIQLLYSGTIHPIYNECKGYYVDYLSRQKKIWQYEERITAITDHLLGIKR